MRQNLSPVAFDPAPRLLFILWSVLILLFFIPSSGEAQNRGPGFLYVYPEPARAEIEILGMEESYMPGLALPPGTYELRISCFGYRDLKETIEIKPGKNSDLFVELTQQKSMIDPESGMEFVWIPAGCFQMGCGSWAADCDPDERPVHEVCLSGFWMSRYEVSQQIWNTVMGTNPSRFQGSEHPVEQVTWELAGQFAAKLMKYRDDLRARLPSEAQWEYAARGGGRQQMYAGGDEPGPFAWFRDNSRGRTHRVGSKEPNDLGLFDMSGNAWEWCRDSYDPEAYAETEDGNRTSGDPVLFRIRRGGSWDSGSRKLRTLYRGRYPPGLAFESNGLRIVLEAADGEALSNDGSP